MYERETKTKLSGRVEVDDAYLGGELPGGKAGCGSENKSLLLPLCKPTRKTARFMQTFLRSIASALMRLASGPTDLWYLVPWLSQMDSNAFLQ
jgi:hypothetical protein